MQAITLRVVATIIVVLATVPSTPTQAAPISFTFSATGTGWKRDSQFAVIEPFTNAAFIITASGDTANIVETSPGIFAIPNVQASIDVAGVGVGEFLIPTRVFVNHAGEGALGFSKVDFPPSVAYGADLVVFHGADFSTYGLNTSIGPVVDHNPFTRFNQFRDIKVGFGLLSFNDDYVNGTFVAAVPEPSALVHLISGFFGALVWFTRLITKARLARRPR